MLPSPMKLRLATCDMVDPEDRLIDVGRCRCIYTRDPPLNCNNFTPSLGALCTHGKYRVSFEVQKIEIVMIYGILKSKRLVFSSPWSMSAAFGNLHPHLPRARLGSPLGLSLSRTLL